MQKPGPRTKGFFRTVLRTFNEWNVPFLVGGGYAMSLHTGSERPIRDLDLFVLPSDFDRVLQRFEGAGFRVDPVFPHWLGKIYKGKAYVDVIFSSGNGVATVDGTWFEHAPIAEVLDVPVRVNPVEEMIWSKSFVMERERYDGADVAHLLLARGSDLDWQRLLDRFGPNRLVLLNHVILFLFVYPSERDRIPDWVWDRLLAGLDEERRTSDQAGRVCRGALLSRGQFLGDLEHGFRDPRLVPEGSMTSRDVAVWTEAAKQSEESP